MILTCLALTVLTPFLIGLVMFLLPGGRKGNMRTERDVAHDGLSVEQAKSLYADRLVYDGFVVTNAANPARLEAMKPKAPSTEVHTHGDKGLQVEIDFAAEARGVRVRLAAWMNDYIIRDTGEGRLIDLTLDRLVTAELDREPPPVVPNTSLMALSSLVSVLLSMAIIVALSVGSAPRGMRVAAVVAGAVLACLASMFMALQALQEIRRRPAELTGKGMVAATMIAGVVGVVGGAVALYVRFGATIAEATRQLFR
jgi:hypothetical protein